MIAAASNSRRVRGIQGVVFWLLRLATYFVLACATYIFLDIGIKGSRTVFRRARRSSTSPFLTQPPQTLYVFDYEGKKLTMSDREFRDWKAAHPGDRSGSGRASLIPPAAYFPASSARLLLVVGSMVHRAGASGSAARFISTNTATDGTFIRLRAARDPQSRRRALDCFRPLRFRHCS